MTDNCYNELKELFGKDYADANKQLVHSGSQAALHKFLQVRRELHKQIEKEGNLNYGHTNITRNLL